MFFVTFAPVKRHLFIGMVLLIALAACHGPQREARLMVLRAERLFDTDPDSTVRLIDSVLRTPAYFEEGKRMDMALLQAEALFGDRGQEIPPLMDDEFFDDKPFLSTSPELERAADYYARKKKFDKAAHAALYSGFVQLHYNDKADAIRSFKDAERYGELDKDSLAMAQAEFRMGKLLFFDGMELEALAILRKAMDNFGSRNVDKAINMNMMAVCYMVSGDHENAEICLQQSLMYARESDIDKLNRKILNNYAVLYQLQNDYKQALACLKLIDREPNLDETELLLLYMNTGDVFAEMQVMDSAALYYKCVDSLLPHAHVKTETKVSAYNSLSRFAESQHNDSLALHYWKHYNDCLDEVRGFREHNNLYGIQQKYDYDSMQNAMNQKMIRRQRIIIVLSMLAALVFLAFAVSKIRLAQSRKQEAEAKDSLFLFMQQHKELQKKHETSIKTVSDLSMMQESSKKDYQELAQKYNETAEACTNYARQLSETLNKEALVIQKMCIFINNQSKKRCLKDLEEAVFGDEGRWEALKKVFDSLYPEVREKLMIQHPELTEAEIIDFILSFFEVSRQEEADLFGTSIHSIDKLRNNAKKKLSKAPYEGRERS